MWGKEIYDVHRLRFGSVVVGIDQVGQQRSSLSLQSLQKSGAGQFMGAGEGSLAEKNRLHSAAASAEK